MNQRSFYLSLLPFLVIIVLGIVLAFFYNQGRFVSWVNLGQPPAESINFNVIRYERADPTAPILISTDTAGTHHFASINHCDGPSGCWRQMTNSSIVKSWGNTSAGETCNIHPALNIDVPSNTKMCISHADMTSGSNLVRYAYFVQIENGDVLMWSFVPAHGALIIFAISLLVGVLVTGFMWGRAG